MNHLSVSLERQAVSARSRHGVVRLVVENTDPLLPVRVDNIVYDMTEGLTVRPFENAKVRDGKQCIITTCAELRRLVNDCILGSDTRVTSFQAQAQGRDWRTACKRAWLFCRALFSPTLRQERRNKIMERQTYGISISDSADAELVWKRWFEPQEDNLIKEMFALKLEQLKQHEKTAAEYNQDSWKRFELPPGSAFSQVFVTQCKRGLVNEIPESVTFKLSYSVPVEPVNDQPGAHIEWEAEPKSRTVCETFVVTPVPFILTAIAVFTALAGKGLTDIPTVTDLITEAFGPLKILLTDPVFYEFFSAGMLALIIFPALEYTPLGKKNKIPINWRTALLVGLLIGLFQTNIMESLSALATGSS